MPTRTTALWASSSGTEPQARCSGSIPRTISRPCSSSSSCRSTRFGCTRAFAMRSTDRIALPARLDSESTRSNRRGAILARARELMASLQTRAYASLGALALVLGAALFVPAGTLTWWNGWVYLAIFVGLSAVITADLLRRDPALLERRMKGGPTAEKRPPQRVIMLGASIGFIALLVIPALDFRFGWSTVPIGVVLLGQLMFIFGFGFIGRVYQENTYTSATIEVAPDQRVISTGPYAIVRHPMYASALLYVLGTPLALGSWVGLLAVVFMAPFLVWRLLDEERMLARELPGYTEYQQRVGYRLIPRVW